MVSPYAFIAGGGGALCPVISDAFKREAPVKEELKEERKS